MKNKGRRNNAFWEKVNGKRGGEYSNQLSDNQDGLISIKKRRRTDDTF